LELEAGIETKEHANREKDRAVLPTLRPTLALKKGMQAGPGLGTPTRYIFE
jgi:hypothetical protein